MIFFQQSKVSTQLNICIHDTQKTICNHSVSGLNSFLYNIHNQQLKQLASIRKDCKYGSMYTSTGVCTPVRLLHVNKYQRMYTNTGGSICTQVRVYIHKFRCMHTIMLHIHNNVCMYQSTVACKQVPADVHKFWCVNYVHK